MANYPRSDYHRKLERIYVEITRADLQNMYKQKTVREMAAILKCTRPTIYTALKKNNIPLRRRKSGRLGVLRVTE